MTVSLAGRTAAPLNQPVPTRRGGFGGANGLTEYLLGAPVHFLIDATHPYAATISANATQAAARAGTPLLAVRRPPWRPVKGDRWIDVVDAEAAVRALGEAPRHVFLALGRQDLQAFTRAPQHHYVVRSVDPVEPPLPVPHARYVLSRGPFAEGEERELLLSNAIDVIVAKNSGGSSTYGKIAAARALSIAVMLYRRPLQDPQTASVATVDQAVVWLDHALGPEMDRGV